MNERGPAGHQTQPQLTYWARKRLAERAAASEVAPEDGTANSARPVGDTLARAHWFGPRERPLFGWLHLPLDGRARAGIALCPPLATERINAHATIKLLAEQLARRGFLVLRFDYDSTGDSAGSLADPGLAEAWKQSTASALNELRRQGAEQVGLVGIRLGAVLAALAAEQDADVHALVLWDPVVNGKAFLRQQIAYRELLAGRQSAPSGDAELIGFTIPAEEISGIASLELPAGAAPLAAHQLTLTRPGQPSRRLRDRLGNQESAWMDAEGQMDLLEVPSPAAAIPLATLGSIVEWLDANHTSERQPLSPDPAGHTAMADLSDGVNEWPVQLGRRRGPGEPRELGLFGVACAPVQRRPHQLTVLMLNTATEPHLGPARLWVELARLWAARGVASVRLDLGSMGDSPRRPGEETPQIWSPCAVGEVCQAIDLLRATSTRMTGRDPLERVRSDRILVLGLCSGANLAIEASLLTRFAGVLAVNYAPWFTVPGALGIPMDAPVMKPGTPETVVRAESLETYTRSSRGQAPNDDQSQIRRTRTGQLTRLKQHVPPWGWSLLDLAGIRADHARRLELAAAAGTDLVLLFGSEDAVPFETSARGRTSRLARRPNVAVVIDPALDHACHRDEARRRLGVLLTEQIDRHAAGPGWPNPPQTG